MRKWEARLNELKTPREYAALARELDIAKKTNQTAERGDASGSRPSTWS